MLLPAINRNIPETVLKNEFCPLNSSFSSDIIPPFAGIYGQLAEVKTLINRQLTASQKAGAINQLLEYVNTHGGKMIRPGLVLLAGKAMGTITDEHIRVAAIMEMIHNATLLHDDVIDEGQIRRGKPTINNLWGNESAVLLGDFLLSRVFNLSAAAESRIAKEIAATAARVCEGELRQVTQKRNWQLSEAEYIDIITAKSASLFSSCCYLGGLLAGGAQKHLLSLRRFGLNAGIAFQITDDLLDIVGDERKTGKSPGSDVDKNKLTLAVLHLLRAVDEREKKAVIDLYLVKREALPQEKNKQHEKHVLVEMLKSYGSLKYVRNRAQQFVTKAIQTLASLRDNEAKEALIETAKFMANRVV